MILNSNTGTVWQLETGMNVGNWMVRDSPMGAAGSGPRGIFFGQTRMQ